MRSIVTLICGIVVVAAVFMPWFKLIEKLEFSGWDIAAGDLPGWIGTGGPILTFIGGLAMICYTLMSFVLPRFLSTTSVTYQVLPVLVRIGAGLVMVGAAWTLIDATTDQQGNVDMWQRTMYGIWIALAGGAVGLFAGLNNVSMPWIRRESTEEDTLLAEKAIRPQWEQEDTSPPSRTGEPSPATPDEDHIPKSDPLAIAKHYFDRAVDLEAAGNYEDAIEAYNRVIRLDPDHALALYNRGLLLIRRGDKDDAAYDFERVIEIAEDDDLVRMARHRLEELGES